jgi:hypothetical protein
MNKCKCGQDKVKGKCLRCSTWVDSRQSDVDVEHKDTLAATECVQVQPGKWVTISKYLEAIKEDNNATE